MKIKFLSSLRFRSCHIFTSRCWTNCRQDDRRGLKHRAHFCMDGGCCHARRQPADQEQLEVQILDLVGRGIWGRWSRYYSKVCFTVNSCHFDWLCRNSFHFGEWPASEMGLNISHLTFISTFIEKELPEMEFLFKLQTVCSTKDSRKHTEAEEVSNRVLEDVFSPLVGMPNRPPLNKFISQ